MKGLIHALKEFMWASDILLIRCVFTFLFSLKTWQADSHLGRFLLEYSHAGASVLEEWAWSHWGWSTSFEVVSQVSITLDLSYKSFLIICLHYYKILHRISDSRTQMLLPSKSCLQHLINWRFVLYVHSHVIHGKEVQFHTFEKCLFFLQLERERMRLIHQEAQRKLHLGVESSTAAFFIFFGSLFTSLLQL